MIEEIDRRRCVSHSTQPAVVNCRVCGATHCNDCFFDPILEQCEQCFETFISTVELPSRSIPSEAYVVIVGSGVLIFFLMLAKQWGRDLSFFLLFISAFLKGAMTSGVLFQMARTYAGGKIKGDGRAEFEAEYLELIGRLRNCLEEEGAIDLNSLFNRDFSALSLEDKIHGVHDFCDAMERTVNPGDSAYGLD